jgi:hypothetical protein
MGVRSRSEADRERERHQDTRDLRDRPAAALELLQSTWVPLATSRHRLRSIKLIFYTVNRQGIDYKC